MRADFAKCVKNVSMKNLLPRLSYIYWLIHFHNQDVRPRSLEVALVPSLWNLMIMMMMMMMNCFCGMVDRRKAFSFISSRNHCQRSPPSRIADTPQAEFKPAQNLSSGLVGWSCAVAITTTPRRHNLNKYLPIEH